MPEPRRVLITGTSSGIGLATAVELARRGWSTVATMRDPSRAGRLRDAAAAAGVAERLTIEALDVTDAASIAAAVPRILAGGPLAATARLA